MFKPHKFETRVIGCPSVKFSLRSVAAMKALIKAVDTEIAWMATAYMREEGDERFVYVDEVYTCEQNVHGTEAELTVDGQAEMMTKLITEDVANNVPEAEWRVKHLRCWSHSHNHMDTNPSGQDEVQAQAYNGKHPWLLRVIANKKGKIRCDLFWFEFGFIIKDMDWEIDYTSNLTDYENTFTKQAKECAHARVYQIPPTPVSMPVHGGVAYPNANFRPQTVIPGLSPVVIKAEPGQQEFLDTSSFNQLTEEAFASMLSEGR